MLRKPFFLLLLAIPLTFTLPLLGLSEEGGNTTIPATNGTLHTEKKPLSEPSEHPETPKSISGLELALKGFLLSQGEEGSTLWRLKATSGSMSKEGEVIIIDQPDLIYYLPPDNAELHVFADKGEVDQAKKLIRFMGNVSLAQSNSTIKGDVLLYSGNDKIMELPQGGVLEGTGTSGKAEHIIWHLDTRVIECLGQVETVFSTTENLIPTSTSKSSSGEGL